MCSRFLKEANHKNKFLDKVNQQFERLHRGYERRLKNSLDHLPVTAVFAGIILLSIGYLYSTAKTELAPQEDQGVVIAQLATAPNATIDQTQLYTDEIYKIFRGFPETEAVFALVGVSGLNTGINGMILKPWDERKRNSNQLQPLVQHQLDGVSGGKAAAFQLPSLPGSRGFPIQFVIQTTDSFDRLNEISLELMDRAQKSGQFIFLDTDLKIDKSQANVHIDRNKASQLVSPCKISPMPWVPH